MASKESLVSLTLFFVVTSLTPFVNAELDHGNTALEDGRVRYDLIQRDSKLPKFGQCWTSALKHLESGCRQFTDEIQSRLALQFANCFLAQAGQKTYPCEEDQAISECLNGVDSNAFSSYSTFFTVSQKVKNMFGRFKN